MRRTREALLRVSQKLKGILDWTLSFKDEYSLFKRKIEIIYQERERLEKELIEQITKENDVIHQLDNDLHTIKNKVEPLVDNYKEIIGKEACDMIDRDYAWYQKYFGYID